MSFPMTSECYLCLLKRHSAFVEERMGEAVAAAFARDLMELYLQAPIEKGSPWFGPGITALLEKHCGITGDRFFEEKQASNRFVMERLEDIRQRILQAPDPLYAGMQMAVLGNYIDFAALRDQVSFDKLDAMLEQAAKLELDRDAYGRFREDLERGKNLLYITDNAGEIGFDRLFAEEIAKAYPHLSITFCVRGAVTANDATRADAQAVELPFPVVDNGCDIAGTELERLGDEGREAFERADVLISKGQANVETLLGCGLNIYYLFLLKCPRFIHKFGKPQFTPMLLRERP